MNNRPQCHGDVLMIWTGKLQSMGGVRREWPNEVIYDFQLQDAGQINPA